VFVCMCMLNSKDLILYILLRMKTI